MLTEGRLLLIDEEKAKSIEELKFHFAPLLLEAREGKLFFYRREKFFDLWFSPNEFEVLIGKGNAWLDRSWILRDPQIRMFELEKLISLARVELNDLKDEVLKLRFAEETVIETMSV